MCKGFIAVLACLFFTLSTPFAAGTERIEIVVPTVEDETAYVWQTLQDMPFFDKYGYDISLPDDPLVQALLEKSRGRILTQRDRANLERLMREKIYDPKAYQIAVAKIESRTPLLNRLINQLDKMEVDWPYRRFDTYQVNLTLYGPGGSFNPSDGSILLFTTPKGTFKQYRDPANTIIHEVVHIGIESAIVLQFNLPHPLKERIVDQIVNILFKEDLPDYRIQQMGYAELDNQLKDSGDIENLTEIIDHFIKASEIK